MIKRETDLFPIVKNAFKNKGYTVYAEVAHFLRGIDLVAVNEEEHIAVELKLQFNDHLVRQAGWDSISFDKVYVAFPVKKAIFFHKDEVFYKLRQGVQERITKCEKRGIGILQILPTGVIFEALEAKKQENIRRMNFEHHKEGEEDIGGLPNQKGVSAGYYELETIKDYVLSHPNCSWKEIFENVHTHYADHRSLAGAMRQWRGFSLKDFKKDNFPEEKSDQLTLL